MGLNMYAHSMFWFVFRHSNRSNGIARNMCGMRACLFHRFLLLTMYAYAVCTLYTFNANTHTIFGLFQTQFHSFFSIFNAWFMENKMETSICWKRPQIFSFCNRKKKLRMKWLRMLLHERNKNGIHSQRKLAHVNDYHSHFYVCWLINRR